MKEHLEFPVGGARITKCPGPPQKAVDSCGREPGTLGLSSSSSPLNTSRVELLGTTRAALSSQTHTILTRTPLGSLLEFTPWGIFHPDTCFFPAKSLTDLLGDGDRDIFLLGDLGFLGDRDPLLLLLRRLSLQEREIKVGVFVSFLKLQIHLWLQNQHHSKGKKNV